MKIPNQLMPLPVGTSLEKYEILAVLGQGGCGITYLAMDAQLNRQVVLKEHFPLGLCQRMPNSAMVKASDEKSFDRSLHSFCKEARVLAALRHPNIVGIHEVFGACGTAFLVTDYIKGKSLQEWMAEKPTGANIRRVMLQLLDTLEYLHAANIIHRDIKPDNILLQDNNEPVLIDFGAALQGDPTHTLTLIGTPAYAAPEQFRQGERPGPPADIFALGKSFLLTANSCGVKLPARMRSTLQKATREETAQRFQNATAWKHALTAKKWILPLVIIALVCIATLLTCFYSLAKEVQTNPPAHPLQLVRHTADGNLIRPIEETLPPREEEFVSTLIAYQQELNNALNDLSQEQQANKGMSAQEYNKRSYQLHQQRNDKTVELIEQYLKKHYDGKDPYAEWTRDLIHSVKNMVLDDLRPYTH
ncbi:MAG: serine/threonine protein kinase [Akkermansia sp.]|nr:serine/threonine protein kinase [Akkermansia sp.]